MNDMIVLFGGIAATILFLVGFGHTIYEFRQMEDERYSGKDGKRPK